MWALREVWRENHEGECGYGFNEYARKKVKTVGGGAPSNEAIRLLVIKFDDDEEWYPGKQDGVVGSSNTTA